MHTSNFSNFFKKKHNFSGKNGFFRFFPRRFRKTGFFKTLVFDQIRSNRTFEPGRTVTWIHSYFAKGSYITLELLTELFNKHGGEAWSILYDGRRTLTLTIIDSLHSFTEGLNLFWPIFTWRYGGKRDDKSWKSTTSLHSEKKYNKGRS